LLKVRDLYSQRASCDTLSTSGEIRVGDEAGFAAGGAAAGVAAAPAESTASLPPAPVAGASPAPMRARPWAQGRVGARWLSVRDAASNHFEQPMLDLRLDGGSDDATVAASLDLRGRRTAQVTGSGERSDVETRVYRAAITWRPAGQRASITAGRIASPSLAPVSLFDGALIESAARRWRAGVFAGTQPDPSGMRISSAIREYGGYVETHQRPLARQRWTLGLGAVSSYDQGQPNRDFLFGQVFWQDPVVSASLLQEADIARGWKRAAGEPGFAPTSTFLTAQARATPWLTLQTGWDNRRSIRLWRDHLTPETEFDDAYRQGVWAGAGLRFPAGIALWGDQRWRTGAGERATTSSGMLELSRPAWRGLALRGRYSDFRDDPIRSRLTSASIGVDPHFGTHVEISGGERRTDDLGLGAGDRVRWWSADGDVSLGRLWYATLSGQRERGEFGTTSQIFAGLSRRL
jgi:hypothetical protein